MNSYIRLGLVFLTLAIATAIKAWHQMPLIERVPAASEFVTEIPELQHSALTNF